jgi:hypothetical protein
MHLPHLIVIITEQVKFNFISLLFYIELFFILVDFTEFMLAIALTQSGDLDERLALAFDMYDYNNTGTSKLKMELFYLIINFFLLVDTNEMAKVIAVC